MPPTKATYGRKGLSGPRFPVAPPTQSFSFTARVDRAGLKPCTTAPASKERFESPPHHQELSKVLLDFKPGFTQNETLGTHSHCPRTECTQCAQEGGRGMASPPSTGTVHIAPQWGEKRAQRVSYCPIDEKSRVGPRQS